MDLPFIATTMARRGLITPGNPVRIVRQFGALGRWGFGLAGELRQAAARSPERIAVIDDERRVTYAELLAGSERVAHAVKSKGIKGGDRVGLLCRNSARMIEALIGITSLGADPVLINTGLSAHQLATVAEDQELSALIHDEEFAPQLALVENIAKIQADKIPAKKGDDLRPPEKPGRTIVLTSGTTGTPKGARRPTPGGFGPLCSVIDRIPLRAGDRILLAAPLFHTWGFAGLQIALALRATIVLHRRFDAAKVHESLIRNNVDALIGVPVMVQQLMDLPAQEEVPTIKTVAVSGSALPGGLATRFMDRYGDVLYNLYGSTEASWVSIATPEDLRAAPNTAGRPPFGTTVKILGEDDREVPASTVESIHVVNEMLFEGYIGNKDVKRTNGLLGTGDLGHLDDTGRLFIDGRQDDMIVSGGENVFPSEVESLLADVPQIREAAVIGVPDDEYGQRLAAYIVLRDGEKLTPDEVRDHVRRHRARFCVPRDVTFLDALPRNATGKVVTRELHTR
ncbi:acyl-CoA synthetase (AMP-forming)/AMP-acid ligase II [Actinoplanes lutulentus]|uniref:Acyl-CoA synthetase (AMP-forming)/AMP-acid ligase II n=1 Tax=Actinoplanes lutulentus TaxID=1287878 RepID=A0A327ZPD9_9ACTN|nr:AMP-binding protein [Actinoplanes lutulentus]MBB2944299.1 acyl-CoA synthetase (AMP-forming)/AMP-acid ligase II [Actinoplanes lutulentus]RAK42468.1 acyl-CoA synthetase (AMP-forming)/AMP-acid ligase II [Actinoplanes lutulentus]